jgi:hypothetical protein
MDVKHLQIVVPVGCSRRHREQVPQHSTYCSRRQMSYRSREMKLTYTASDFVSAMAQTLSFVAGNVEARHCTRGSRCPTVSEVP